MALDLPDDARRRIADWRDRAVAGRDDLRPVSPDALHVTLVFLGHRPEKEIGAIAEAAFAAAAGLATPRLAARGLRPLPPRKPRLFALDLSDEGERAVSLQAAISDALDAGGFYRPEKRPFWPHLTLARVKRGRTAAPLEASAPPSGSFEAARVTLYRSTLRPQGALYEALAGARIGS